MTFFDKNRILSKAYFKAYFWRNRKLFGISIILLTLSIVAGYLGAIGIGSVPEPTGVDFIEYNFVGDFLDIFPNNVAVDLLILIGGFGFSIISIPVYVYNNFIIGFFLGSLNWFDFLVSIMPHGIFEIPSIIFAFVSALLATRWTIRILKGIFSVKYTLREMFRKSRFLLNDIAVSLCIDITLLFIAAIIESSITPWLINNFLL